MHSVGLDRKQFGRRKREIDRKDGNMKNKIKFVQFGCGKMGVHTAKFAMEKGAELVAAFDKNPAVIGKDIGTHFGMDQMGVTISDADDADAVLGKLKPDICIITTMSLMRDVRDAMLACARNGVNAISTCEEAIFPWNSAPEITAEIDKVAREHGCTITGTGGNEAQYAGIFGLYGGSTHKTDKIVAKAQYNVDDYGIALAKGHGVGLSAEEFEKEIAAADKISEEERAELIKNGDFLPSYVWNTNGWICDYLGLTVTHQTQQCIPKFSEKDIFSKTLDRIIPAGEVIGMGAVCTTSTEEGMVIETECIGIVYGEDDEDVYTSVTTGVPDTDIIVRRPDTVETTCAIIVNRIPDVINAEAGFVPTSQMPTLKYRAGTLEQYCR